MSKKTKLNRGIAKMLATRFVEVENKVRDDLYECNDSYYESCELNREILYSHPKLYDSITGEGDTVPLNAEEHEALIDFLVNGFIMDKELTLCMHFRGFVDCLEYLKSAGAIKRSYLDMDFFDICIKHPSEFEDLL